MQSGHPTDPTTSGAPPFASSCRSRRTLSVCIQRSKLGVGSPLGVVQRQHGERSHRRKAGVEGSMPVSCRSPTSHVDPSATPASPNSTLGSGRSTRGSILRRPWRLPTPEGLDRRQPDRAWRPAWMRRLDEWIGLTWQMKIEPSPRDSRANRGRRPRCRSPQSSVPARRPLPLPCTR
jgi:hypothetical protein